MWFFRTKTQKLEDEFEATDTRLESLREKVRRAREQAEEQADKTIRRFHLEHS